MLAVMLGFLRFRCSRTLNVRSAAVLKNQAFRLSLAKKLTFPSVFSKKLQRHYEARSQ